MRVLELGEEPCLALKSGHEVGIEPEFGGEDFDGDATVEGELGGGIDGAH